MKPIKTLKNVLYIITVVIISAAILVIGISKLFGVQMLSVISGSMEPEIPVGSMIVAVPVDFEKLEIGDDISYVRDKKLTVVTHRIIGVDNELMTVTTKGIANDTPDKPVHKDNIVGKVALIVPYLGYPVSYLSDTKIKIILLCIFAALIIIMVMLSIIYKNKPGKINKKHKDMEELL